MGEALGGEGLGEIDHVQKRDRDCRLDPRRIVMRGVAGHGERRGPGRFQPLRHLCQHRCGVDAGALDQMRDARGQAAASAVALANPTADAGLICLDLAGRIGQANTAYVAGFPGLGAADRSLGGVRVTALCNAITPAASLAELIVNLALAAMQSPPDFGLIRLSAGLPVRWGLMAELIVNADMEPVELQLPASGRQEGAWCGGSGPRARLTRAGRILGRLIDELFLTGIGPLSRASTGGPTFPSGSSVKVRQAAFWPPIRAPDRQPCLACSPPACRLTQSGLAFWWHRFGPMFAVLIRKRRVEGGNSSRLRWRIEEMFMKVNGGRRYLDRQETGQRVNNRAETSHVPFRR